MHHALAQFPAGSISAPFVTGMQHAPAIKLRSSFHSNESIGIVSAPHQLAFGAKIPRVFAVKESGAQRRPRRRKRQASLRSNYRYRLVGGHLGFRTIQVALPEVGSNFVERALLPLFGLGEPKNLALGIQHGALPAHKLLAANLHQLSHELHSCGVKPIDASTVAESGQAYFNLLCGKRAALLSLQSALHCNTIRAAIAAPVQRPASTRSTIAPDSPR